jgi:hypothetical protein
MAFGLAGLVSGGLSSSATSGVNGARQLEQALQSAINQDNSVFVGGSGKARNSKTLGEAAKSNQAPLIIAGSIIGLLILVKTLK